VKIDACKRKQQKDKLLAGAPGADEKIRFSSNAVRLSGRWWATAVVTLLVVMWAIPAVWDRREQFRPGVDYRLPYTLSEDYYLYGRYCQVRAGQEKVLVVGDSVVWGEYVRPDETLHHYLNELTNTEQFANLGVNGMHPVSLSGLIADYAKALKGRRILLHYNPLWMSSRRHDLQVTERFQFNHARLAPQFAMKIPCYHADWSERLGIVLTRRWGFYNWMRHVKLAYYGTLDLPGWLYEHPYENPLGPLGQSLPAPSDELRYEQVDWRTRGLTKHGFEWVTLEESLQWRQFQQTLEMLRQWGNEVVVLVGPFNEHMLTAESLAAYKKIKAGIAAYLSEQQIPYVMADPLPSELYADASHPLPVGYEEVARQILARDVVGWPGNVSGACNVMGYSRESF
jgi:hypothetical protein